MFLCIRTNENRKNKYYDEQQNSRNFALAGAPFYVIGMYTEHGWYKELNEIWFTGAWALTYMLGWMCSMVALQRLEATGTTRFGKGIL